MSIIETLIGSDHPQDVAGACGKIVCLFADLIDTADQENLPLSDKAVRGMGLVLRMLEHSLAELQSSI